MSETPSPEDAAEVALFGTSADPPSLGHRALLEGLARRYPLVATWASDNPYKRHGAPLAVRAALLRSLVDGLGNPHVQVDQGLSSPRAIESLAAARRRWPSAPFVYVVGSDLVGQIPRWFDAAGILRSCRLAVVPRVGWPLAPEQLEALEGLGASIELLPLQIPATASSEFRRHPNPELVPADLWPVLVQQNLYGLVGAASAAGPAGRPPN